MARREIVIDASLKRMLLGWLQHGIDEAQYKELCNNNQETDEELLEFIIENDWKDNYVEHCELFISERLCIYNAKTSI